jgi:hypothetical protein
LDTPQWRRPVANYGDKATAEPGQYLDDRDRAATVRQSLGGILSDRFISRQRPANHRADLDFRVEPAALAIRQ